MSRFALHKKHSTCKHHAVCKSLDFLPQFSIICSKEATSDLKDYLYCTVEEKEGSIFEHTVVLAVQLYISSIIYILF